MSEERILEISNEKISEISKWRKIMKLSMKLLEILINVREKILNEIEEEIEEEIKRMIILYYDL